MANAVGLAMQISANTTRLAAGLDEVNKRLSKTGNEAKKASNDLGVLKTIAIGGAVIKGFDLLASGLTSAASAAIGWANNVRQSIDATGDLAARTGIAVEALQGFQTAANLTGVQGLDKAVQKLTVTIGQAAASGKTDAFKKLGIDFDALQTQSPEDQFRTIAAAISKLPTQVERAAAAVKIFGKAGVELLPLFEENLAAIEERSKRLGIVLSGDQVSAVQDMNDALDLVKMTFDGIIGQVTANLAPVISGLAEEFLTFVEGFQAVEGGQIGGGGIADAITSALFDWAEFFAGIIDTFLAELNQWIAYFQGVAQTFVSVGDIFQRVGDGFTAAFLGVRSTLSQFVGDFAGVIAPIAGIFSSDAQQFLENFAQEMRRSATEDAETARKSLSDAVNGRAKQEQQAVSGPVSRVVSGARQRFDNRNSPEAQAERAAAAQQKLFDRLNANLISSAAQAEDVFGENVPAAVQDAGNRVTDLLADAFRDGTIDEGEQKKIAEAQAAYNKSITEGKAALEAGKKAEEERQKVMEKIAEKAAEIESERMAGLSELSTETLKASDVRSSEGASTFLRLVTGKQDPAIAEYQKQLKELQEMRKELKKIGGTVEIAA
jgi:hypothetical protein